MTWLRIDDGMVDHRKWAALESDPRTWAECLAVWVALASYCQRTLSDGHVPEARLARLTPLGARAKARCDDMVRVGLMELVADGYVFHDWLEYQSSRAHVEAQREQKARRQQRWRDGRVDASTRAPQDASRDARVEPAPSHPIPSHPTLSTRESDARAHDPVEVAPRVREALTEAQRAEAVRAYLGPVWRERTGATPPELSALTPRAEVIAALAGMPDRPELDAVVARFFDDPAMAKRGWPLSWLLRNPAQWSGRSTTRGGHAPPRKAHEYEARELSFDELMREREAALGGGTHG